MRVEREKEKFTGAPAGVDGDEGKRRIASMVFSSRAMMEEVTVAEMEKPWEELRLTLALTEADARSWNAEKPASEKDDVEPLGASGPNARSAAPIAV